MVTINITNDNSTICRVHSRRKTAVICDDTHRPFLMLFPTAVHWGNLWNGYSWCCWYFFVPALFLETPDVLPRFSFPAQLEKRSQDQDSREAATERQQRHIFFGRITLRWSSSICAFSHGGDLAKKRKKKKERRVCCCSIYMIPLRPGM